MIIQHFTDNDLYKFTTMYAIQKLYPNSRVRYQFFNRAQTPFPKGFAKALRTEIDAMADVSMTQDEWDFMKSKCYYFDHVFLDLLKTYRFDPAEVQISQNKESLALTIEGYWYKTVLWEVPLMAMISELFFKMSGQKPRDIEAKARYKAQELVKLNARFSDFGTRRRFSFKVHEQVVAILKKYAQNHMVGTSNVYLAMKNNLTPIGTHPHEWFMYHAAQFGYKFANHQALQAWAHVYQGALGIALTDTYTSENFFENFSLAHAKLFDGLRWDSGDPIEFAQKVLDFYKKNKIDASSKTIVFSDSLNLEKVARIRSFVNQKINDAYGIGTYFTNDVGVKPLNMVIKLTEASGSESSEFYPTVKLSDVPGKNTGRESEIRLCKQVLKISE
jgi:nicotinate phosphoribosyltransferase